MYRAAVLAGASLVVAALLSAAAARAVFDAGDRAVAGVSQVVELAVPALARLQPQPVHRAAIVLPQRRLAAVPGARAPEQEQPAPPVPPPAPAPAPAVAAPPAAAAPVDRNVYYYSKAGDDHHDGDGSGHH